MAVPRVSIVMPTFNRADTLRRAVDSVRAQRFEDWELLVVDDGSTDDTKALLDSIAEPRMAVFRQPNTGVAGARNVGLRAVRGELVAFLDSDDEWAPHHLALMVAFFDAHPGEQLACGEFWEVFGPGRQVRHCNLEMSDWYPKTAHRIGSARFLGAPPQNDPLLRFYETKAPIGAWAATALAGVTQEPVFHYRGDLFPHWRWGWLDALQPTVLRRALVDRLGPFDTTYRVASDFPWLAQACALAPMNFFTVPCAYKHEYGHGKDAPKEAHLVTGKTAVTFHEDVLRAIDALYARQAPGDPELAALEGLRHSLAGSWALQQGQRERALFHLQKAAPVYRGFDVALPLWLARTVRDGRLASRLYRASLTATALPARLRHAAQRLTQRSAS